MTSMQNDFNVKQAKCGRRISLTTAAVLAVQHEFLVCYSNLGISATP